MPGFHHTLEAQKKLLVQGALTYFTRSDSRKGVRCLLVNTFPNISSDTRPAMLSVLSFYTPLRVLVLHTRGEFPSTLRTNSKLQLVNSNNNVG